MATSRQLRNSVARLSGVASSDVAALFRQVSTAAQARQALSDVLPAIVEKYGSASAALAAEWYDQQRAKADVRGRFEADPVDLGDAGAQALAGWASQPLETAEPDWSLAKTLIVGGLSRRIANYARETIMQSSIADPGASGWQRETDGDCCSFCQMLADRGLVFSESSADFASHDHCGCSAVPAFGGEAKPVKAYTKTRRTISDKDRARTRAYLRDNYGK